MRITSLTVFPFEMHPDKEHVKQALVTRGRKFESLRGVKHQHYSGSTPPDPCAKIPVYHVCPLPEPDSFVGELLFT